MGIKGSVTINIDDEGTAILVPPLGVLDRNIQTMQWSLVAPGEFKFAPDPIVFQTKGLPPGYRPWTPPGQPPVRENDWQVRAQANLKVEKGDPPVKYRYDIYVDVSTTGEDGSVNFERRKISVLHPETLEKIDPDMENQPQP